MSTSPSFSYIQAALNAPVPAKLLKLSSNEIVQYLDG